METVKRQVDWFSEPNGSHFLAEETREGFECVWVWVYEVRYTTREQRVPPDRTFVQVMRFQGQIAVELYGTPFLSDFLDLPTKFFPVVKIFSFPVSGALFHPGNN